MVRAVALPGRHAAMAGLATSGTLTHWFRERFARELPEAVAIAILSAEAECSPPGAKGLVVLPYFSGERTPIHDPHAKGLIFGLDLTHERGDLFRAILEGIAYGTRHAFETYSELGQRPRAVYAVGGERRTVYGRRQPPTSWARCRSCAPIPSEPLMAMPFSPRWRWAMSAPRTSQPGFTSDRDQGRYCKPQRVR